ncbi:toxin co-regulated pilus biosynthesis Q family protein [Noviherbaspirillum cavernae]|uniref:toxin co-regulated pilus biosynthesis Q family protein n=1 Tax=Noviherbaspirillum cavernae TaxID=2320862 RepID=UPI001F5B2338|nr:toxin co-regulated pilus biosynthesis Q family protein [Noviherbaspirillum cavernae]
MDSKIKFRSMTGLTMQVIGAVACCVSVAAHAAEPIPGMNLKLDLALINPVLKGEECDEEGDLLVQAKPASAPLPVAMPSQLPVSAPIQLARLSPSEQLNAERAKSSAAATQLAATPAAKPAAPARPVPAASQVEAPKPTPAWDIVPADKTLNAALARWAAQAGWQLVWELPVDYAVEARTTVPGTFEEAVATVTRSMDSAEIPMKAIFYDGNKVLRIVAKGVE